MKFDSSSRIQTDVAKAFSLIWEKLTQLEDENKELLRENERLRHENAILNQNLSNPGSVTPRRRSHPSRGVTSGSDWDDYSPNRYDSQNEELHEPQPRQWAEQRHRSFGNKIAKSPLSPRRIIDNDRRVRVKMLQSLSTDNDYTGFEDEAIIEDAISPRRMSSFRNRMNSEPIISPRSRGSGPLKPEYPGAFPGSTTEDDLPVVKRILVYRNGDTHHAGEEFTLNMKRFATFNQVIQLLNEKMYMGTPIRKLYQVPEHKIVRNLDDLMDGQILLAVGGEMKIKTGSRYPLKIKQLRDAYIQQYQSK